MGALRPNQFKLGNTVAVGNRGPAGRAQQRMATQTLISILHEPSRRKTVGPFERREEKNRLYDVMEGLVQNAESGDVVAQKYIMDRLDGTPTQMIGEDPENPMKRPVFFVQAVVGGPPQEAEPVLPLRVVGESKAGG